jgi:hypothetical protein
VTVFELYCDEVFRFLTAKLVFRGSNINKCQELMQYVRDVPVIFETRLSGQRRRRVARNSIPCTPFENGTGIDLDILFKSQIQESVLIFFSGYGNAIEMLASWCFRHQYNTDG